MEMMDGSGEEGRAT